MAFFRNTFYRIEIMLIGMLKQNDFSCSMIDIRNFLQ
eukprot:UN23828